MFSPLKLVAVAVVVLIVSAAVPLALSLQFAFSNFSSDDATKIYYGDSASSTILLGAIQVTADTNGKSMENLAGRALFGKTFGLWKRRGKVASFNTSFVLNIMNQTNPGGEGLAFILTGHPAVPPNSHGKWLGIVSPQLNGSGEAKTVAIEFDTRRSFPEDLDGNHVGLNINSIFSTLQVPLGDLKLSLGVDVQVNAQYIGKKLSVFVANNQTQPFLALSAPIDLSEYLPKHVYVGFSGSTSNFTQLNCVKSWSFDGIDKENDWWVLIGAPLGVAFLLGVSLVCYLWKRHRNQNDEDEHIAVKAQGSQNIDTTF